MLCWAVHVGYWGAGQIEMDGLARLVTQDHTPVRHNEVSIGTVLKSISSIPSHPGEKLSYFTWREGKLQLPQES